MTYDDPESADAAPPPRSGPDVERARALLAAASVPRPRSRQWLGSRRRQVFAGVVVLGAIGYIAFQGLTSAAQYYLTTRQAVARKATLGVRSFRIEGIVDDDVRQDGRLTDFDITKEGVTVRIVSTGSPSQLFKPGIPVVLVGHWHGSYYASSQIMVKHTADYTEVSKHSTSASS